MPVVRSMSWWRGVWHAPLTPQPVPWSTCRRCGLLRDERRHDREAADYAGADYLELEGEDETRHPPPPSKPRPRPRKR